MTTFRLQNYFAPVESRDALLTVVAWDLDSTLADTQHRHYMIPKIKDDDPPTATWEDYSLAAAGDEPMAGTIRLMRLLAPQHRQVIITGRSAAAFEITRDWLAMHSVPADEIRMRPAGDETENGEFKVSEIREIQQDGYEVILMLEDWVDAVRRIEADLPGLPVVGINPFYDYAPEKNENTAVAVPQGAV
jgi:hypothetical protein